MSNVYTVICIYKDPIGNENPDENGLQGGYIRSWVFAPRETAPPDLLQVLSKDEENKNKNLETDKAKEKNDEDEHEQERDTQAAHPTPDSWKPPFAYFHLGQDHTKSGSGCSPSHFKNMHLVLNLAFCGAVAGQKFWQDCPHLSSGNQSRTIVDCESHLKNNPTALNEAYWSINSIHVFRKKNKLR